MTGVNAGGRDQQTDQCCRIFGQHRVGGRVFAAVERHPERLPNSLADELLQSDGKARPFEDKGGGQHDVVPHWVAHRLWVADVLDAFIERHAAAQPKDQHRDDQAPEIELLAVPERMLRRRGPVAQPQTDQQQDTVESVDRRVNAFRQHGRAARHARDDELGYGDRYVGADRAIDCNFGFGHVCMVTEPDRSACGTGERRVRAEQSARVENSHGTASHAYRWTSFTPSLSPDREHRGSFCAGFP